MELEGPWKRVTWLFHFTERENLASIEKHDGLWSLARLNAAGISIPKPGGNDWSREADTLKAMDEYVHLCFTTSHPMEYCARQEGHLSDVVYLRIDPAILTHDGVCFSPGVSNKSGVPIVPIEEAVGLIDFDVLYTHMDWKDPEVQARRQTVEKYEILVPDHVPLRFLRRLLNG